uniref:Synaptopodin 2-like protein n=1 Tax=Periophthalmus magnuspinnatus TaxID=409849 RepID=A0A3B4AV68_9GOBI
MVAEEIVVSLSGGAPWGFRLQGGAEEQRPLQVAKVRRRSKACRAGLKEQDELVSIGEHQCSELSHAEAMNLLDQHGNTLTLRVKRPSVFASSLLPSRILSPSSDVLQIRGPSALPAGVTSPPDSEAYYGETDSDADTQSLMPRRQRRTPPHGDSGFQEAGVPGGGSVAITCPPLVSPERAKEALMLASGSQLVPMVGPQESAVNDELSTTYKDKARQAKLPRGESQVERQVKEARTKCRSIASLLTDAPNPNSKGVLMFKKRRQRAKKYTLTCFGKAPEDKGSETEGETEEEGGSSILSGSEVDEEGFSASYDPTWDSGYLDLLERRSSACLDTLAYQDSKLENGIANQPISSSYIPMSPPAMPLTNGGAVEVSRASVMLTPPSQPPIPSQNTQQDNPSYDLNTTFSPSAANNVLNRTARPFTPGPSTSSRPSVTSVMFRPPQPKPISSPAAPVTAVSMMTLSPPRQPDAKRAVSSTSLYIPARNANGNSTEASSIHSPPSSLSSATTISQPNPNHPTFSPQSSINPTFNPQIPQHVTSPVTPNYQYASGVPPMSHPYPPQAPNFPPSMNPVYNSPTQQQAPPTPNCQYASNAPPISQLYIPDANQMPTQPPPSTPANSYFNTQVPMASSSVQPSPPVPSNDSLASREQRIAVPAVRTGILSEARKRSQKKPMFSALQSKDVNPNPDLLSIIQNMDDSKGPNNEANGGVSIPEAGHESGPEEDWLRLGAEACNFMQAQRQPKPPPVAPKPKGASVPQLQELPQTPQMPVLGGKGGQLFAKRQNRMDRYVVERSPSVAGMPYSPAQTRESSPTPSLPATWKYSSNIRAPPPINYNPLLSPSCPLVAQKKQEPPKSGSVKTKKTPRKPVDLMNHQPYQLNSSLFSYGGGANQDIPNPQKVTPGKVHKTAKVIEIKRFSTPPPTTTGPALKVIAPRSATTLGQPMWRSDITSPPPQANARHLQSDFFRTVSFNPGRGSLFTVTHLRYCPEEVGLQMALLLPPLVERRRQSLFKSAQHSNIM